MIEFEHEQWRIADSGQNAPERSIELRNIWFDGTYAGHYEPKPGTPVFITHRPRLMSESDKDLLSHFIKAIDEREGIEGERVISVVRGMDQTVNPKKTPAKSRIILPED